MWLFLDDKDWNKLSGKDENKFELQSLSLVKNGNKACDLTKLQLQMISVYDAVYK